MQAATKKIALVTGANKGIGFELARQLAKQGCTVLLGARDAGRGKEAANKLQAENLDVRALALDLSQPESITSAAQKIATEFGHLDILINNAGVATQGDATPSSADMKAVRTTFETNFFATIEVTQAMLPLLRKARAARIVNVSSGLGSLTHNSNPDWGFAAVKYIGYNASKAALNMLTVQLAAELRDTAIKVNSADPGYTATDLNGNSGTQTIEEGAAEALRLALLPEDGPTGGYFSSNGPEPW